MSEAPDTGMKTIQIPLELWSIIDKREQESTFLKFCFLFHLCAVFACSYEHSFDLSQRYKQSHI